MAILRKAVGAVIGMIAAYALKKMIASVQVQAEKIREQAEAGAQPRDPNEMKQLKQDPVTGVYYAED
jgi:hypothetical protein